MINQMAMLLLRILMFAIVFVPIRAYTQEINAKMVLGKMFESIEGIRTLKFKLKKKERVNGLLKSGEQDVKFNRKPKKVYTYVHAPNKGVEILYLEGKNSGKAYVNPNAFPYMNLNLDPYGSIMRKGNHHTVNEVGFDYIKEVVNEIAKDTSLDFEEIFLFEEDAELNNIGYYKLTIDYKPFKIIPYKIKNGENITDLAYRLNISDFMILELNKIDDYHSVKPGQEILIPNAYAKKTILYIDKKTFLPVVQIMYDEQGLYEQYEFSNIIINSKINDEEFQSDNSNYGF